MIFPDVRTVLDSGVLVVNILVMLTVGMAVLRGGRAAVRTQTAGPGGNRT